MKKSREELLQTEWAKKIPKEEKELLLESLHIIEDIEFSVSIIKTKERNCGIYEFAIIANNRPDNWWLSSFPKKKEAIKMCKELGWPIKKKEENK